MTGSPVTCSRPQSIDTTNTTSRKNWQVLDSSGLDSPGKYRGNTHICLEQWIGFGDQSLQFIDVSSVSAVKTPFVRLVYRKILPWNHGVCFLFFLRGFLSIFHSTSTLTWTSAHLLPPVGAPGPATATWPAEWGATNGRIVTLCLNISLRNDGGQMGTMYLY